MDFATFLLDSSLPEFAQRTNDLPSIIADGDIVEAEPNEVDCGFETFEVVHYEFRKYITYITPLH